MAASTRQTPRATLLPAARRGAQTFATATSATAAMTASAAT